MLYPLQKDFKPWPTYFARGGSPIVVTTYDEEVVDAFG